MALLLSDDQREDLKHIRDVDQWPLWPALPLMGRDNKSRCGLLMNHGIPRVYHINFYAVGQRDGGTWEEKLLGVPYQDFDTFESLVHHWRVD